MEKATIWVAATPDKVWGLISEWFWRISVRRYTSASS